MTDILQEASELINGQRAQDYGDVTENFERIASLWSGYKQSDGVWDFSPHDVAMMMILVKVARQSDGYHRDSIVDIAGYAALDEKVNDSTQTWANGGPKAPTAEEWDEFDAKHMPTTWESPNVPRVWGSLADVPKGVHVCGYGDEPERDGTWIAEETTEYDHHGPFTEVLS